MKRIFSTSEIIGTCSRGQEEFEVCATAEADYDEDHSQIIIELYSFIRPVDIRLKEQHLTEPWLPHRERLKEIVERSEASDLAREVFHGWVAKVRQSIPLPVHFQP